MKRIILLLSFLLISCPLNYSDNLISAVYYSEYQKIQDFVSSGANVNEKDTNGDTPLIIAARNGNAPIVKYLCDSGANVNLQNNDGWTALHYASYYGFEAVVQVLLRYNVSLETKNKEGYTALWYAMEKKNETLIELLKNSGAKPLF